MINVVYELPFGNGKFRRNPEGWRNRLVSGWSVNSIMTAQSGFPFTPQLSYNPSRNGDTKNPVRPFLNPSFTGPIIVGKPGEWFNPTAFMTPPNNSGFYGNPGRDICSARDCDMGFLRDERTSRFASDCTCNFVRRSSIS